MERQKLVWCICKCCSRLQTLTISTISRLVFITVNSACEEIILTKIWSWHPPEKKHIISQDVRYVWVLGSVWDSGVLVDQHMLSFGRYYDPISSLVETVVDTKCAVLVLLQDRFENPWARQQYTRTNQHKQVWTSVEFMLVYDGFFQ